MFTKCYETFTRTYVWWETIPDGRSSSTECASAKWQVTSCNRQRLAEADRRDLHGLCWWSKLARYGGLPVFRALKVSVAIFNLIHRFRLSGQRHLRSAEPHLLPVPRGHWLNTYGRRAFAITGLSAWKRVGHGMDPSIDWIGLSWVELGGMTVTPFYW